MIGSKMLVPGAKCILMDTDLAGEIGKSAALLLQQIHYWQSNEKIKGTIHDSKKWIINSYDEWAKNIKIMSVATVKRAAKKLKDLNLIHIDQLFKVTGNRTNCITINYDRVNELISHLKNPQSPLTTNIKMSLSSDQNDPFYKDKTTNKDINYKSDEKNPSEQVQQVMEIIKYTNVKGSKEKTNSSTTVQDMLTIWNNTFPKSQAKLDKELSRNLNYAFQNKFDSNIKLWEHYCLTIESSSYLTGDKFSLRLDWAIKFKTMEDIKNGRYGIKNIPIPGQLEQHKYEALLEIESLDESEECRQKRLYLLQKYGIAKYECHLKKAKLYATNGKVYFIGQTAFLHSEIEKAYRYELYAGIQEHFEECQNQPVEKFDSDASQSTSKPTDLDLELLIIDNSITEPELIKQKRRTLCYELGVQTYRNHFRNLSLIEREGGIFYIDRSGHSLPITEKIREILKSSLLNEETSMKTQTRNYKDVTDVLEIESIIEEIDQKIESERCRNTRKAFLLKFGVKNYRDIFKNMEYRENGNNIDFKSDDPVLIDKNRTLIESIGISR